jgi:hypothetical protein
MYLFALPPTIFFLGEDPPLGDQKIKSSEANIKDENL